MPAPIRVAIIGAGKIARDQHVPSIAQSPDFTLAAAVSPNSRLDGVPNFPDLASLLDHGPPVDAVAVCTGPQARYPLADAALRAGKHVFLEKPPGATVSEVHALDATASARGVTLFASWHSRHAAYVETVRGWLAPIPLRSASIVWHEDVRKWHPGQDWVFAPGGFGVFDPGINALSILTRILPFPIRLTSAELKFPSNRDAPIAAELGFSGADGFTAHASFDWRHEEGERWDIDVVVEGGTRLALRDGGARIEGGSELRADTLVGEYPGLYRRFAQLIRAGQRDVDLAPLQLTADAFLLGARRTTDAFEW